ncbi:hypothetical protein INT47_003644 [Mucor saturninus]|uniref:Transcriptional regulatory protein RXT2 N-terminal domain-containing protein n=1 Tax=Mucor saturninus TaxID=64648 RepID=A0A8H7R994_9FUNG|nr:hypothetical protein INT47_003644 [Mucor saturninus]
MNMEAHSSNYNSSQPPPPAAAKWIQDNEDSDTDQKWAPSDSQFGGNKLRAPKTLAEETEFTKGGKKRTIVKRKKRRLEDGISDEEEDPYTLINIEDILSPIELPTDIVRRPALRRILLSTQIDALARTSMEFIEGEKNFNKILCRLSAIMHHDDPRYLDLTFDRTLEQRKKYKQDVEAASQAAATLSQAPASSEDDDDDDVVEALDPKVLDAEVVATIKEIENQDEHVDTEVQEVVKRVKELLLENINYSNEYISRLQGARNKLCKASMQKETLWKELKANAKEEDLRNKASFVNTTTNSSSSFH